MTNYHAPFFSLFSWPVAIVGGILAFLDIVCCIHDHRKD